MKRFPFPAVAIALALIVPFRAAAIPPPDFLIAIGSSFGQIFSLVVVLLSGLFAAVAQTVQAYRPRFRIRPIILVTAVVALTFVSTAVALVVDQARQRDEIARIVEKNIAEATARMGSDPESGIFPDSGSDPTPLPVADASYFHDNETLPLDISNEDFAAIESTNPYVLDAREDEEVEIGRYPGSVHVRLADLLDGAYSDIPRDRTVYVFC
ncbi:MAG: rhodanese-like domain-containing protein [Candidatus Uhrbacteria bacterium]